MEYEGLAFPNTILKKTALACFGPLFRGAGYKKGYKGDFGRVLSIDWYFSNF